MWLIPSEWPCNKLRSIGIIFFFYDRVLCWVQMLLTLQCFNQDTDGLYEAMDRAVARSEVICVLLYSWSILTCSLDVEIISLKKGSLWLWIGSACSDRKNRKLALISNALGCYCLHESWKVCTTPLIMKLKCSNSEDFPVSLVIGYSIFLYNVP